jgi:hypothetical protein
MRPVKQEPRAAHSFRSSRLIPILPGHSGMNERLGNGIEFVIVPLVKHSGDHAIGQNFPTELGESRQVAFDTGASGNSCLCAAPVDTNSMTSANLPI